MVVAVELRSGSCLIRFLGSNLFILGIKYYMHRRDFGSLRVDFTNGLCIGLILSIVLWDITHEAFLQHLACKHPHHVGVEAQ